MSNERRRSPRMSVLGELHGRFVALDMPVTVMEISLGGMGIQTEIPLPVGAVHDFQLTLGDGSVTHLQGRVVHCNKLPGEEERYVSGVQFVDENIPGLPRYSDEGKP